MPSPIPINRFLQRDHSLDLGPCSSPLSKEPTTRYGCTLQVPSFQRLLPHGGESSRSTTSGNNNTNKPAVRRRGWSSVIFWKELRRLEPVASGGFGSVYRGEYFGEVVAVKKVKKSAKNKLASRQSFWAELNAAHLRHENVVRFVAATTCAPDDTAEDLRDSIGTIVMEYAGDRTLHHVIYGRAEEALGADRWCRYSSQIIRGLCFLHSHGIVHLDLKPANVLVSGEDVCKLVDFGCSLKLDGPRGADGAVPEVMRPQFSQIGGTYTHRAPELLKGEGVSCKADIYSFAIVLWQLVTRELPYPGGEREYVMYAVVAYGLRPSVKELPFFQTPRGLVCTGMLCQGWSGEASSRPSAMDVLRQLEIVQPPP